MLEFAKTQNHFDFANQLFFLMKQRKSFFISELFIVKISVIEFKKKLSI